MQDFPKLLGAEARVGFTQMDRWLCFSAVKNNVADARKKAADTGFAECGASMHAVDQSLGGAADMHARFQEVYQQLLNTQALNLASEAGERQRKRLALTLYYLYGPKRACASLDNLYPHGKELPAMLADLGAVREKLAPRAAQHHYRSELATLAQSAVTRLGRSAVGRAVQHIKRGAGAVVRAVQEAAEAFSDLERYFYMLKPIFCLLGMIGFFYAGDSRVAALLNANGSATMALHVLFGQAAGLAFTRMYDVFAVMNSVKGYPFKAFYLSRVILNYLLNFFETFLPDSKKLWDRAGEMFLQGQSMSWKETGLSWVAGIARHLRNFGGATLNVQVATGAAIVEGGATAGAAAAGVFKDWCRLQAAALGVYAATLFPIQAFMKLGARLGQCIDYVAPGGLFGDVRAKAPFLFGLLEVAVMVASGNVAYVMLRLLEFACTEFHSAKTSEAVRSVCAQRAEKYRTVLMLFRSFARVWAFFASGGVTAMLEVLSMLMGEGLGDTFQSVCIGELPHDKEAFQKLHDTAKADLNITTRAFQDSGDAEDRGTLERLAAAHNAHLAALKEKHAWRNFVANRSSPGSSPPPPGAELLQSQATTSLGLAEQKMGEAERVLRQAMASLGLTGPGVPQKTSTMSLADKKAALDAAAHSVRKDLGQQVWEKHHARIEGHNLNRALIEDGLILWTGSPNKWLTWIFEEHAPMAPPIHV
jgi:hypothetical protein